MFKEEKYYGEIWFAGQNQEKSFCVLSITDNEVNLETNLHSTKDVYKSLLIYGSFIGLGYITFLDSEIIKSIQGITVMKVYKPRYTYVSGYHQINPFGLKFKNFSVTNEAIVDWVYHSLWYDPREKELTIQDKIKESFEIKSLGLVVAINHSVQSFSGSNDLSIRNSGWLEFELKKEISVLEAIEIYNTAKNIILFLSGYSNQFDLFSYQLLNDEKWADIYYKDREIGAAPHEYIRIKYDDVKVDLPNLFSNAYENESFIFCFNKLLGVLKSQGLSHSKKFVNSISVFEAFCKLFSNTKLTSQKKYFLHFSDYFMLFNEMSADSFNVWSGKVIRSRDYHVHSNLKNKNIFSDFELLYISYLLDFVVGYGMLKAINVSEELLEHVKRKGKAIYHDMQFVNNKLKYDPLTDEDILE